MGFHSVDSDLQIPRDRFVAQTQGEQPKDLIFAARQHVPLWSLGEESRYRRPQVVAAAKKRPDTCKEVANWRAGQQETMDALLECGSNRMLASLGGDHEDTGQLQVFRELNALPNLGESGRRRAVCDHDVDILIDADGVFLEDFDVLLSRKGCANAELQKWLRNAYADQDSLPGFVLTHFTLLGFGKWLCHTVIFAKAGRGVELSVVGSCEARETQVLGRARPEEISFGSRSATERLRRQLLWPPGDNYSGRLRRIFLLQDRTIVSSRRRAPPSAKDVEKSR